MRPVFRRKPAAASSAELTAAYQWNAWAERQRLLWDMTYEIPLRSERVRFTSQAIRLNDAMWQLEPATWEAVTATWPESYRQRDLRLLRLLEAV